MGKRIYAPVAAVVMAFVVVMGIVAGLPAVTAQTTEATPADGEAVIVLHPAHIHSGTCDTLGDVVYPLNELQAAVHVASPVAASDSVPAATPASPVAGTGVLDATAQSATEVDVSLEELLGGEYAINVHESPENIQNYIACGEITGSPSNDELTISLQELNNSGYIGEARLTDTGEGTTIVHVSLFPTEVTIGGTPVASPAS